jgi:hypothetical protein
MQVSRFEIDNGENENAEIILTEEKEGPSHIYKQNIIGSSFLNRESYKN